ncbi:integrase catalytic domain-containing protein [Trichonephila clavipes]|nr:integrase catalytic domain-containing protein [Trichonephila clavipes]
MLLMMGGADHSGIFYRTSKIRTQFGGIRFSFPITEGLNSSARECQHSHAWRNDCTHKYWGASSDFPALQKGNELRAVTLRWFRTNQRVMGIHKRHISSYSAHVNGRVEKPNQSLANILASISQNTNDWDEQLPHTMLALNSAIHEATYTSPFFLEHGRDIRLSYTYEKNSDTPQNKYEYVEKLLPSLEQIFNEVLNNLKEQEASHVDLNDLQSDETEVKGIVPSPRYNLRARAGNSAH